MKNNLLQELHHGHFVSCLCRCSFFWLLSALLFTTSATLAKPSLILSPLDQKVKLGAIVTLECAVDSDSKTEAAWFHNGNKIKRPKLNSSDVASWESEWTQKTLDNGIRHTLIFEAVTIPTLTAGLYSCRLWNDEGSWISKDASITISTSPNFVKVPEDKSVLWGEAATLSCQLKTSFQRGSVMVVSWYHNGRLIDISADPRISSDQVGLQINSVQPSDDGVYYCVASKPSSSENFTSSNGSIKVVYPPRHDPNGLKKVTGLVSKSLLLSCPMIGVPKISCHWSRAGNQEIPATRAMQTENRLAIGHVQSSDAGDYICSCSNEYGESRATVHLDVPTSLEFAQTPIDTVGLVGHDVKIPCLVKSFDGNHQFISIIWARKERPADMMFQGDTLGNKKVLDNGTLVIWNLTIADRGNYECKALNPISGSGQITKTISLEVREHKNTRPPVITTAPFNHSIKLGGKLRLPCAASSDSTVTIEWRFLNDAWGAALNNVKGNDMRINPDETGALIISDVRYEDTGLYKCIATTLKDGGISERSAVITVKKDALDASPDPSLLPRAVGKPIVLQTTSHSVTLEWQPGTNVSPEYVVEMYSYDPLVFEWKVVGKVTSQRFTVENLSPDQDYEFLVRGVNSLGVGLPSPVSCRVRTVEISDDKILGTEIRDVDIRAQLTLVEVEALEGVAVTSTSAWIQWNVVTNSHFAQGFLVKYSKHDGGATNLMKHVNYITKKVNDSNARALLVSDLDPWSSYMATVQPYYDGVPGIESDIIFFSTPEGTPTGIVDNIKLHKLEAGRYLVKWDPLAKQSEGHIIGYNVALYFGESKSPFKNINTTKESCIFTVPDNDNDFRVSVAARTRAGVGVFSPIVGPNDVIVTKNESSWIIDHPWVLAILGGLIWVFLAIVSFVIWRKQKKTHYKTVRQVNLEPSLQPLSEYPGGQWQIILPSGAQRGGGNMGIGPPHYMTGQGSSVNNTPSAAAKNVNAMMNNDNNPFCPSTIPMATMKHGPPIYGQPDCLQPLMLDLGGPTNVMKNNIESVYQCGDCYEECNPVQCNNSGMPQVTTSCSCNCPASKQQPQLPPTSSSHNTLPVPPNHGGGPHAPVHNPNSIYTNAHIPMLQTANCNPFCCCSSSSSNQPQSSCNCSPETHHSHLGMGVHPGNTLHVLNGGAKYTTNPNRYQYSPTGRSTEHLYNELDHKGGSLAGNQINSDFGDNSCRPSPPSHHYEVYDSEGAQHSPGISQGNSRQPQPQIHPDNNSNRVSCHNNSQLQQNTPPPLMNSSTPTRNHTNILQQQQQPVKTPVTQPAPPSSNTTSHTSIPAVSIATSYPGHTVASAPAPRMSCPRMGMAVVRNTNYNTPTHTQYSSSPPKAPTTNN